MQLTSTESRNSFKSTLEAEAVHPLFAHLLSLCKQSRPECHATRMMQVVQKKPHISPSPVTPSRQAMQSKLSALVESLPKDESSSSLRERLKLLRNSLFSSQPSIPTQPLPFVTEVSSSLRSPAGWYALPYVSLSLPIGRL